MLGLKNLHATRCWPKKSRRMHRKYRSALPGSRDQIRLAPGCARGATKWRYVRVVSTGWAGGNPMKKAGMLGGGIASGCLNAGNMLSFSLTNTNCFSCQNGLFNYQL